MKFFGDENNNDEQANKAKSNLINFVKKKKGMSIVLKAKIAIIVIAVILGFLLLYLLLYLLFNLGSLNSMESAMADRFKSAGYGSGTFSSSSGGTFSGGTGRSFGSGTLSDYEKKVLEQREVNNVIQYFSTTNETQKENHEKYFDALYDAYEFYKEDQNQVTIWSKMARFFAKLFKTENRKKEAPLYPKNSNTVMYGVKIDTSLITSSLYNSRYQADMLDEDKFDTEYSYFVSSGQKYGYDLHTGDYRDIVENNYLYDVKHEDEKEERNNLKKAIEGIELLAKYQIKRIETFYTIHPEFNGTYTDTTRHIEITIKTNPNVPSSCYKFVKNYESAIGPDDYYHRSTQGELYSWDCSKAETLEERKYCEKVCEPLTQELANSDDYVYCKNNELTEKSSDCIEKAVKYTEGDIGLEKEEPVRYELACEDYNEYLLGNLPKEEDVEMFCGYEESGKAKCYCNRFIEAYYDKYVDDDDVDQKRKDISEIVFTTYSMYQYFENATNYGNVCSKADVNYESERDLSCEGARNNDIELDPEYYIDPDPDKPPIIPEETDLCLDYTGSDTYNSSIANQIIDYASQFQGIPYQLGSSIKNPNATNPKDKYAAIDCSDFVEAVYEKVTGADLNSSAAYLASASRDVCVNGSDMQPGDMMFYSNVNNTRVSGRFGSIYHVGIYLGNGMMIDASSANDRVIIRPVWGTVSMITRPYAK